MLELRISQQFARIGLDITRASFDLKHTKPDLEVTQAPAEMTLNSTKSDLNIDYSPMLQSLGFGDIGYRVRAYNDSAQKQFLINLEKNVQTGYRIAAIENKESIGDIIFQALRPQEPELGLVSIAPLNISYTPAELEFEAQLGKIDFNFNYGRIIQENFVYPAVKVFMEQEPYLKIEPVGQALDIRK